MPEAVAMALRTLNDAETAPVVRSPSEPRP